MPKLVERCLDRTLERWQIVFYHKPNADHVNSVVFVPQEVANGAQFRPRSRRAKPFGEVSEFLCCLV
jgi:hypothetical protein